MTERRTEPSRRALPWLAALGILAVFLALRARGIGHLLIWDEAMDLCSVRAFVTHSRDAFSNAIWAHPPLFPLLMSLLQPLRAGFAERCEWLSIGVQAVNLLLVGALTRRVCGPKTALWSCAILACLPGAVFFDGWIKRDHLVVTFALLALLALSYERILAAGACLGAALLAKESALFYLPAIIGLSGLLSQGRDRWRNPLGILVVSATACVWWYVLFANMTGTYLRFALGREANLNGWNQPWTYYVERAWNDLGPTVLIVLAAGLLACVTRRPCRPLTETPAGLSSVAPPSSANDGLRCPCPPPSPLRYWPLAVLIPAYLYLGFARGKAPWLTMVLYPAWAVLAGMAVMRVGNAIATWGREGTAWRRVPQLVGAGVLGVALLLTALHRTHAREQEHMGFGQSWGSGASRGAALTLNRLVQPGQRVLFTPFWYWGDDPILTPCPIFAYYLNPMPVLLESFHLTPEQAVEVIRRNQITWALLSPPPVTGEAGLLNPLIVRYGLTPRPIDGAVLFRTDALWKDAKPKAP